MDYMTRYYKNLCEQLSSDMTRLMADLDARAKAREENQKLQSQSQAAFDAVRQKEMGRYNIPGMPNLSANVEFSSQSRARAGSGIATPETELDSFYALGQEKQQRIAPGLSTSTLSGMQQAQYNRSQGLMSGTTRREKTAAGLNPQSVEAQNLISRTIQQRKENPMGGSAAARTYVDRARTQSLPSSFNARELQAISNEAEKEGKAQFAAGQKTVSPGTYAAIRNIDDAQKARREKDAQEAASLMASREANVKRMYGDQWMKYV